MAAACLVAVFAQGCSRSDTSALREAASWIAGVDGSAASTAAASRTMSAPAQLGEGLVAQVTSSDPALRQPAALTVDDRGQLYVLESAADVGAAAGRRTTLRVLIDDDRDGLTDRSRVVIDGFGDPRADASAGVLQVGRDLYVARAPDLLRVRLVAAAGDVAVDTVEVLHTGFGMPADGRTPAGGARHGLRGPVLGPDGRLYFSIGDRGAHVPTGDGGWLDLADTGAVLRCELDGGGLEVVAVGLRDPQRLAFDADGNLFTADSLVEDRAPREGAAPDLPRILHVVAGGDYGWRSRHGGAAGELSSGWSDDPIDGLLPGVESPVRAPAGLVFHPGTGFDPDEVGRFVVCDVGGGVATFRSVPRGASFGVADVRWFVEEFRAVDAAFGSDGALWVVQRAVTPAWPGAAQLQRIHRAGALDGATVAEVRRLLRNGVEQLGDPALVALLGHPDLRLRVRAHLALATRPAAQARLRELLTGADDARVRLHALWSLGVAARRHDGDREAVAVALRDADAVVCAQAAQLCGELDLRRAGAVLVDLLNDRVPAVQLAAALALARVADVTARPAVLAFVARNGDRDPFLSHAGVQALRAVAEPADLERFAVDPDPSVRRAALIALRRDASPRIAVFLDDPDASLRTEAARAIHDVPIPGAVTGLADRLESAGLPVASRSRAIAAANRAGRPEDAERLARLARDPAAEIAERVQALRALAHWAAPEPVDPVLGAWRPLDVRDPTPARDVVLTAIPDLVRSPDPAVFAAFVTAVRMLRVTAAAGQLAERVADERSAPEVRAVALAGLAEIGERAEFGAAVEASLASGQAALVEPALGLAPRVVDAAATLVERVSDLARGATGLGVRQEALRALGALPPSPPTEQLLLELLGQIDALPAGLHLDVLEAAEELGTDRLRVALGALRGAEDDPLARWRVALDGGDEARGEAIFAGRMDVSCQRCHAIGGVGGRSGPALDQIGAQRTPEELLQSVLFPASSGSGGYPVAMPDDARRILSRREVRDLIAFLRSLR